MIRLLLALLVWVQGPSVWALPPCNTNGLLKKSVLSQFTEDRALSLTGFGFAVIDTQTGDDLCSEFFQGDQNLYPASSIKTLIALATLRKVDLGLLKLDQIVTINQVNAGTECTDWGCSVYGPGKKVSLKKLIYDMITVSNNLATNQLIDVTDRVFINQVADLIGAPSLRVNRKVYNQVDPEPTLKIRNRANALGMVELYREVATGKLKILSDASKLLLVDTLRLQHYHETFNYHFPNTIFYYHKPGETSSTISDGGYYFLGQDKIVILVGLLNMPRSAGLEPMRRIGRDMLDLSSKLY